MEYIAYLPKDKDSDYWCELPGLSRLHHRGRTLEEARRMAVDALALHIQGLVEDGLIVPEPSKLDDIQDDPNMRHGVAALVVAELPSKRVRVNITALESQIAEIDRLAEKDGLSRSVYFVQSALGQSADQMIKRARPKKTRKEVA